MTRQRRYSRWKKFMVVCAVLIVGGWGYVQWVNRNSMNMTGKQKFIKAVYPIWMKLAKLTGKKKQMEKNEQQVKPAQDIFNIPFVLNSGDTVTLDKYKGKKILLVNTASNCGYTPQYAELQELYEKFQHHLVIIGFPANDFGEQERGDNEQIAQFCKVNFGVSFPLAKKSVVVKGGEQNPVFQWLTDKNKNGWNNAAPTWNFSKYLINEQGVLTHHFEPAVSPLNDEVLKAVEG